MAHDNFLFLFTGGQLAPIKKKSVKKYWYWRATRSYFEGRRCATVAPQVRRLTHGDLFSTFFSICVTDFAEKEGLLIFCLRRYVSDLVPLCYYVVNFLPWRKWGVTKKIKGHTGLSGRLFLIINIIEALKNYLFTRKDCLVVPKKQRTNVSFQYKWVNCLKRTKTWMTDHVVIGLSIDSDWLRKCRKGCTNHRAR